MKTKRTKKQTPPQVINPQPGVIVYERYDAPSSLDLAYAKEPACCNGFLRLRKVRITVEVLDEPKELLIERLRSLWRNCESIHNWEIMKRAATALGVELSHSEYRADFKKNE